MRLYVEVHYRPCNEGAKHCRAEFEGMAAAQQQAFEKNARAV